MELFQNHCDFPWLMITMMMMMMTTMVMIDYEMEILKKRFLLLLE